MLSILPGIVHMIRIEALLFSQTHAHTHILTRTHTRTIFCRPFCQEVATLSKWRLYFWHEWTRFVCRIPFLSRRPPHWCRCVCTYVRMYVFILRESFVFFRLSRPPKGRQKRNTEKAKVPKITKILQEREILAGITLKMCTRKFHSQWIPKIYPNINM